MNDEELTNKLKNQGFTDYEISECIRCMDEFVKRYIESGAKKRQKSYYASWDRRSRNE